MESLRWFFRMFRSLPRLLVKTLGILLAAIFLLYYPIGMLWINAIDDNLDFTAPQAFDIEGGSHAVAIAEALINREVNVHRWVANDPFFQPGAALIRMPAFQKGILASLARFGVELSDQIGRARGTSQIDSDLEKAAGLLKYSPNVWLFDLKTSWLPTTSSETQYLSAMQLMGQYNQRLAKGQAIFERRADNLMTMLERIATDMGSSSAVIDTHIREYQHRWFDPKAADKFFFIKGRMYADYLLLRELKRDFPDLIKEKQLETTWDNMLESLREGAELRHFFVFNADVDSQFFPNHLGVQGFYLMRARTQLQEVANILLK